MDNDQKDWKDTDPKKDVFVQIIKLKERCYVEDVFLKSDLPFNDKKHATRLEGFIAKTFLIQKDIERFMDLDMPLERKEVYLHGLALMLEKFIEMIEFEQSGSEKKGK